MFLLAVKVFFEVRIVFFQDYFCIFALVIHIFLTMKRRLTVLISLILLVGNTCLADTVDSLFYELKGASKPNHATANSLMIALDADGVVDSLYTFERDIAPSEMMKTVCLHMAYYYDAHYQYARAADAFRMMANYAGEDDDMAARGDALSQAAVEYHRIGDFESAIKANLEALHIDSILGDTALLSNDFSTLAGTYLAAGRQEEAVRFIEQAIEIERSKAVPTKLSIRYGNAAEIYNKNGDQTQALKYAEMAYELDRKAGNAVGTARRLSQMADIYQAKGELSQAIRFYQRAIDILEKEGELHSLSIDYRQLGNVFFQQADYRQAERYLLKADSLARRMGNTFFLYLTAKALGNTYQAQGRYNLACQRLQESIVLGDSIYTERMQRMSADFGTHDEITRQRTELMSLRHKNTLQQTTCAVLILVLLLVVMLFAFFLFRMRRKEEKSDVPNPQQSVDELAAVQELASKEDALSLYQQSSMPLAQKSVADRQFVLKVVDFVHANMTSRKITVELIAQEMSISRAQFTRRLTAITDKSPNAFITSIRMEKAGRLLKSTNMTVNEIAYDCGYDEPSYFIRVFRQEWGMTPQQYRNLPLG